MRNTLERTARRLNAIFAGYDDRAIVMLRACPALMRDGDALQWLARLRESYDDELELLLLCPPPDMTCAAIHERAEPIVWPASSEIRLPLAAEIAYTREGASSDPVTISTWALCAPPAALDEVRSNVPPTFVEALCASPNVGWLLPFRQDTSVEQLAASARLDACDMRRTVLDLSGADTAASHSTTAPAARAPKSAPHAALARRTHQAVGSLVACARPPCGIALGMTASAGLAPASADDHAWQVDATEALLDEIANAVTTRRIASFTRSAFSLRSRL
jgi:hypothetical protein